MPKKKLKDSSAVFDAVSALTRIKTLRLLSVRGVLTYSEIMEMLNLEPMKDAGKFVYHLKNLIDAGLVEFDKVMRKYKITELGSIVVNFSRDLEEYSLKKSSRMLVRTSKYMMEEFDRNRILTSLIEEGGLSRGLADKISSEAEERLFKLPVKYLTAPLIREFVNAILIENGLEDYRHKLTRLGMPVHDVKKTLDETSQKLLDVECFRHAMANRIMTEFMLLDTLPREIADAHLSGQIHICDSGRWMLTPSTIFHDLRVFLKEGISNSNLILNSAVVNRPKSLEDAFALTAHMIWLFMNETSDGQLIDYFNIFLAPFTKGKPQEDVKRAVRSFLATIRLAGLDISGETTIGLEVTTPTYLKSLPVSTGETGKEIYGDYEEESRRLLEIIFDEALKLSEEQPLLNPQLVLKIRTECLTGKHDNLLEKAHRLASKYGSLYIANLTKDPKVVSYISNGERISSDWTNDWEVDTLRVGCLNKIALNLPRIAYEAKKDDEKFFTGLSKTLDMICETFKLEKREIDLRTKQNLLPHLSTSKGGEKYFRFSGSTVTVTVVGLNEAVKAHRGFEIPEDLMPQNFGVEVLDQIKGKISSMSERFGIRIMLSGVSDAKSSMKFAENDVEKFGWSVVTTQGGRGHPYYGFTSSIPDALVLPLKERLELEEKFHPLLSGGHFMQIPLNVETSSESLLERTVDICGNYNVGIFAYTYTLTYCGNCKKTTTWYLQKCSECGTTEVVTFARETARYLPLSWWTHKGRLSLIKKTK